MADPQEEQACASEPQSPLRPWIWPYIGWALKRLAARRSEYGDEKPLRVGPLWIYVYRWGSRSYGTDVWYEDWHALVGWRGGHRSFYICDAVSRG